MTGVDRESPAIGPGDVERVVNAAAADRRWRQPLHGVVAVRGIDVVDHQVEGRSRPGFGRLLGLSDDDMRTAAQFKHRQLVSDDDRAQADRLEPARGGADIDDIEAHMADSDWRTLIDDVGHGYLLRDRGLRRRLRNWAPGPRFPGAGGPAGAPLPIPPDQRWQDQHTTNRADWHDITRRLRPAGSTRAAPKRRKGRCHRRSSGGGCRAAGPGNVLSVIGFWIRVGYRFRRKTTGVMLCRLA
jgi:hypothetical protein